MREQQLKAIVGKANQLLRRWGVNEPQVSLGKRKETVMKWLLPNWGHGSWRNPTYVFHLGGAEIGAYSARSGKVKVRLNDLVVIEGRPCGWKSKCAKEKVTYPFPIHFFLALAAFCSYHFAKDTPVRHFANFLLYAGYVKVHADQSKFSIGTIDGFQVTISVAPNGAAKAALKDAKSGRVCRTGSVDKILALLTKASALSTL